MGDAFWSKYRGTKFIIFYDNLSKFSVFILVQLRFEFILKGF